MRIKKFTLLIVLTACLLISWTDICKCKLRNGNYQLDYLEEPYKSIFDSKVHIYEDTYTTWYQDGVPFQSKLDWLSHNEFLLKSKIIEIDSVSKEIIIKDNTRYFYITSCKKDTIDFVEKKAVKINSGGYKNLEGRFIKL